MTIRHPPFVIRHPSFLTSTPLPLLLAIVLVVAGCASSRPARLQSIWWPATDAGVITIKARFEKVIYKKPGDKNPSAMVFVVTAPGRHLGKRVKYGIWWQPVIWRKLDPGQEYLLTLYEADIGQDPALCDNGLDLKP